MRATWKIELILLIQLFALGVTLERASAHVETPGQVLCRALLSEFPAEPEQIRIRNTLLYILDVHYPLVRSQRFNELLRSEVVRVFGRSEPTFDPYRLARKIGILREHYHDGIQEMTAGVWKQVTDDILRTEPIEIAERYEFISVDKISDLMRVVRVIDSNPKLRSAMLSGIEELALEADDWYRLVGNYNEGNSLYSHEWMRLSRDNLARTQKFWTFSWQDIAGSRSRLASRGKFMDLPTGSRPISAIEFAAAESEMDFSGIRDLFLAFSKEKPLESTVDILKLGQEMQVGVGHLTTVVVASAERLRESPAWYWLYMNAGRWLEISTGSRKIDFIRRLGRVRLEMETFRGSLQEEKDLILLGEKTLREQIELLTAEKGRPTIQEGFLDRRVEIEKAVNRSISLQAELKSLELFIANWERAIEEVQKTLPALAGETLGFTEHIRDRKAFKKNLRTIHTSLKLENQYLEQVGYFK